MKTLHKLAAGLTVASLGSSAFAVDLTDAIADVEQAATDIETLGLAFVGAAIVVVVIGFIRRSVAKV